MSGDHRHPVPDMPGHRAPPELAGQFRREVAALLGREHNTNFPGAQPVSFGTRHIEALKKQDYYVCEKSDGIRCLLYFTVGDRGEEIHYLIDRKNDYYFLEGLHFPMQNDPSFQSFHSDTIIDGELVLDKNPKAPKKDGIPAGYELKYLVFDCLVLDKKPLMHRTLDKRLGYFREFVYKPYCALLEAYPSEIPFFPFILAFKNMEFSYAITKMMKDVLPNLKHGNDGLIFTCRNTPYKFGTDEHILKWKPANENSVDFRLNLEFPPLYPESDSDDDSDTAETPLDYDAMPRFLLSVYHGNNDYRPFGEMFMTAEEWEDMKNMGVPLDDTIVECSKDDEGRWRFMRFRNDKKDANHISTVNSVLESIADAVELEDLEREAARIRSEWKKRAAQGQPGAR
ncbi:mRNA-capping enzyme subunit alpha [Ascobolus immersus RN42]|uniref:mRNA-capping enzyme subunit alpha n=1 Tax=Ascobolus immersus RN42 TaxID=1160509 RepID=A0A3N4IJG2_ASCIM|nr:mRNA-capping enzyme subunit alpha [Ascobolus immersus RN42]